MNESQKNSFERSVYESVHEKRIKWVMSHKPTENRTREPKGDTWIIYTRGIQKVLRQILKKTLNMVTK